MNSTLEALWCSDNLLQGIDKKIPGRFFKWDQRLKYIRHHVQFQGNRSQWLGAVVDCLRLPEARKFTSESISTSPLSADPNIALSFSVQWVGVIDIWYLNFFCWSKSKFIDFLDCCKNIVLEITTKTIFDISEKNKDTWQFNI